MNRQELIKRIKDLPFSYIWNEPYLNKEVVLDMIKQLDEPQKVVVPQFVAEWYEEHKDDFEFNIWDWVAYSDESEKLENKEFNSWINDSEGNPIQTLVNMHQFGYEVEKEPKYKVKVKNTDDYLNETEVGFHFFNNSKKNKTFTRKELEYSDFAWVLDCPGIELVEVKE